MLGRTILWVAMLITTFFSFPTVAQQKPDVAGDYTGTLGPLHLKLHIKAGTDGSLSGALDSPDQGANGIPCSDFHFDGKELSFSVPAVHGAWQGSVSPDARSLAGTWNQGSPMPLTFTREQTFVAAAKPSPVDGIWLGAIHEGSDTLRLQVHVKSDTAGKEYCTLDSLDQDASGIDCGNVSLQGNKFSFEIPPVHAQWSGTLSADGKTLTGTWTQGKPTALNFERQATAIVIPPLPPPSYQTAMSPVPLVQLQSVLNKDLEEALKSGPLAPSTQVGVTIGVVDHGQRQIFSYGLAKDDSIFEIGSITKTFTGLILSQMVEQGKVKFSEPVRRNCFRKVPWPSRQAMRSRSSTWRHSIPVCRACPTISVPPTRTIPTPTTPLLTCMPSSRSRAWLSLPRPTSCTAISASGCLDKPWRTAPA